MRPRLLDLFCGAGGAAMGYHRAGFDVFGVDSKRQPHYPFEFHQGDARWFLPFSADFDIIHASPPCQRYTHGNVAGDQASKHPDLVGPVRELLQAPDHHRSEDSMTRQIRSAADRAADRLDREQRAVDRAKAAVERAHKVHHAALDVAAAKEVIADKRQADVQAAQEALAAAEARLAYVQADPDLVRGEAFDPVMPQRPDDLL